MVMRQKDGHYSGLLKPSAFTLTAEGLDMLSKSGALQWIDASRGVYPTFMKYPSQSDEVVQTWTENALITLEDVIRAVKCGQYACEMGIPLEHLIKAMSVYIADILVKEEKRKQKEKANG